MNEFDLIDRYFKKVYIPRADVILGIGDDAACVQIPPDHHMLISTDTLVSGVHFLPEWPAFDIAYRAAAVSISDMAAMAAEPCWATLAITLPKLNQEWLDSFSQGLKAAFKEYHVALIGGNTTQGPLSLTLTIMGIAPEKKEIRRDGAKPGDVIFVSGELGAAALAVQSIGLDSISAADKKIMMHSLLHPKARVDFISLLRSYASSAIDISDGLSADLNHICVASGVGACIKQHAIPIHPLVNQYKAESAVDLALTGGDDYELCFTVPKISIDSFKKALEQTQFKCYEIGVIEEQHGLRMTSGDKVEVPLTPRGYLHF